MKSKASPGAVLPERKHNMRIATLAGSVMNWRRLIGVLEGPRAEVQSAPAGSERLRVP
jgi:hypothetical protein